MHTPGPWDYQEEPYDGSGVYIIGHAGLTVAECRSFNVEADTRLIAAAPDLYEVAKAYEQWEADVILSNDAWAGGLRSFPLLTQPLWDRLLEIQAMRNAALSKLSQQQGSPQAQGQQNEGAES